MNGKDEAERDRHVEAHVTGHGHPPHTLHPTASFARPSDEHPR